MPEDFEPCLALIQHVNDLGISHWYEVVYWDESIKEWISFEGSKTFEDGERVLCWKLCREIIPMV